MSADFSRAFVHLAQGLQDHAARDGLRGVAEAFGEIEVCEPCDGTGLVWSTSPADSSLLITDECSTCDGTGSRAIPPVGGDQCP